MDDISHGSPKIISQITLQMCEVSEGLSMHDVVGLEWNLEIPMRK